MMNYLNYGTIIQHDGAKVNISGENGYQNSKVVGVGWKDPLSSVFL